MYITLSIAIAIFNGMANTFYAVPLDYDMVYPKGTALYSRGVRFSNAFYLLTVRYESDQVLHLLNEIIMNVLCRCFS